MPEEKRFKEIIEEKLKKMEASLPPAEDLEKLSDKTEEASPAQEEIPTERLFDILIQRVREERTEAIIASAKEEYLQLENRVHPEKARLLVGGLLREVIEQKLVVAKDLEGGN